MRDFKDLKIAVAGTGYVGLSMATLLSQNHQVTAVDVIPEKVEKINNRISPIQDEYIEKFFAEKQLNLKATLDGRAAYKDAEPFKAYVYSIAKTIWCIFTENTLSMATLLSQNHQRRGN